MSQENEIQVGDLLEALTNQRNGALNEAAQLSALVNAQKKTTASLQAEVKELKREPG